mmetsp:Transcript_7419/g.10812  ORF Transcript_7419/g.10812 Transcript_7419/m.10812 type:complete len:275 (+) Transcript_7419:153-977(+)
MKVTPILLITLLSAAASSSLADLDNVEASSFIANNDLSDVLGTSLDPNDWQEQIQCTVDTSNNDQPVVDEDACKSRTDADSNPCVWCILPQNPFVEGACISQSQEEAAGQLCSSSENIPGGASSPDHEEISCLSITDESTCTTAIDSTTSSSNENCMFCNFPIVGGKCVTNSLADSFARFCNQEDVDVGGVDSTFLRGSVVGGDWDFLDPSCLSDDDANKNPDDCSSRTDSNGDSCLWCDAAGVFGQCVSRSQKDYFEDYLECVDNDVIEIALE